MRSGNVPYCGHANPLGWRRAEMVAVGTQGYPTPWFTRSNMGGRFGPMMKHAGYDAFVLLGQAKRKVWISVVNDE